METAATRSAPQICTTSAGSLNRIATPLALAIVLLATRPGLAQQNGDRSAAEQTEGDEPAAADTRPLFSGNSLDGWKIVNFGGEGEVYVEEGAIHLEMGDSLTGITYQGPVPETNYEISLNAKRVAGIDFFCGLTFPVGQSHCSFIVGGWAGTVVGLSSIDGQDASENETRKFMDFPNGRWYRIRVRVTPQSILAWIDDEQVVKQNIVGREISIRGEVELSKPLGIATWETAAALRNIQLRKLDP